jgi:hypothetical protein
MRDKRGYYPDREVLKHVGFDFGIVGAFYETLPAKEVGDGFLGFTKNLRKLRIFLFFIIGNCRKLLPC